MARVLERLVAARLLRLTDGDTPDDMQEEAAHKALVRNCPTLVEWLEDERVALRQRQRLSAAAEQWQRLGRDPGALLQGRLLEEAQQHEDLSELEHEFVRAGVAAEEARARRAARANRLILALSVLATIFGLVATVLAVQAIDGRTHAERDRNNAVQARGTAEVSVQIAVQQQALTEANRQTAVAAQSLATTAQAQTEQQRKVVDTQRLSFAAHTQFRDNGEVALLLAYEASARDDNLVTGQSLRDAIDAVSWRPTPLSGHTDTVTSAVFSPDGRRILTASYDNTARLWGAAGQPLATLSGHTGTVTSAVFSPDGRRILTASDDGTARQYLVRSDDLQRAAACRVGRGLTPEEVARFQVPRPLAFDFAKRQCPPVYSWDAGK
ncbi:hypothetical protein K2Z83_27340 [Oscillochloris sp. ZM17-4]|nr:hypothetical protein [Oscillochloris sp. ZM17-4]